MKQSRAFTVIEVLVVIAVLVVLMAILVPSFSRMREQARFTRWAAYSRQLQADPDNVAYYTFQGQSDSDGHIENLAQGGPESYSDKYQLLPEKRRGFLAVHGGGAKPTWTVGRCRNKVGMSFDGVGSYIDLGPGAGLPDAYNKRTLFGWARADTWPRWRWVASWGNSGSGTAMFAGADNGKPYAGGWNLDDISAPAQLWSDKAWHMIAITYDGANARLYADGKNVATVAKNWNLVTQMAFIGAQVPTPHQFWDGEIDEVAFMRRDISPQQIKEIYTIGAIRSR